MTLRLRAAGITTVESLESKTDRDLLFISDFGRKSLNEVRAALAADRARA